MTARNINYLISATFFFPLQSSPPSSSCSTPPSRHVTRVTATAKVKVEVHTPLPGKLIIWYQYSLQKVTIVF